ncbi:MAG: triose-phosphate isomerase [Desulfotalea sp.]
MKYIIANWKAYKNEASSLQFLEQFLSSYKASDDLQIVIAPSFIALSSMSKMIVDSGVRNLSLAGQDVSPFPRGSYSGAIPADILKDYAKIAIVGHLERRKYFHETNHEATNKMAELADASMVPLLCLDDDFMSSQLAAIADIDCQKGLFLAYTPGYALNANIPEPVESVVNAVNMIRKFNTKADILYGGAVNEKNVRRYWDCDGVSGVFIGKASHDAKTFLNIIDTCRN